MGAATDQRLVVLSNRLPVTLRRSRGKIRVERSAGGLVAALDPAMRQRGGVWIGWPGGRLDAGESWPAPEGPYALQPVPLQTHEVRRYYHGFSNGSLWPLFHSLVERTSLDRQDWDCYESVNALFAHHAHEQMRDDDLVWVHDYHLTRCPHHLRQLRPDARIAFFLHVPFPPYDVYRILPWYREVIRGLLACDLVGFHSPGYVSNFLECVERLLGERVDRDTCQIEHGDRVVQVGAFPIGIDYEAYASRARTAPRAERQETEKIILGVDRLDYTKGLRERLLAYERLLELHRDHHGRVVLIQVAVPSREQVSEYQQLKREVDESVGRINGRFGTSQWTPIRYIHRSVSADRLAALYRDADVALVTPLRDGMNLVAKEYVASQVADPGVLILSRLAGAAETMQEALQVNPYNVDSVADALHRALTMPIHEREERLRSLQRRERRNDLDRWLETFLEAAATPEKRIEPVREGEFAAMLGDFVKQRPVALFLDYDGTLAQIAEHPSQAGMTDGMREVLETCAARPDTQVAIVSGRGLEDVRAHVPIDGVVFAGNHGLEIEGPGVAYRHPDIGHYADRAKDLAEKLGRIRVAGAWVEAKGASLTLHFREAEQADHAQIAAEARQMVREAGFQARDALCAVEARPPIGWDKGHAVLHVLRESYGPGWSELLRTIYVGDDETDEDAFRALSGLGATFRVGRADQPTRARRRLRDVDAVETLLRWLAQRAPGEPLTSVAAD